MDRPILIEGLFCKNLKPNKDLKIQAPAAQEKKIKNQQVILCQLKTPSLLLHYREVQNSQDH